MARKASFNHSFLVFDEEPVYPLKSGYDPSKLPLPTSSNTNTGSKERPTRSRLEYRYLFITHLHSWLRLRQEAQIDIGPINKQLVPRMRRVWPASSSEYFHIQSNKDSDQMASVGSSYGLSESCTPSNKQYSDSTMGSTRIYRVVLARNPYMTWTTQFCSNLVMVKLLQFAKLEYLKAVNSTLGGAYSTMQRAGWARLYAKKQLKLAVISGDQTLELRAKVYLKICEITATLHPSHARRVLYEDSAKGVTTKTDTNVHHSAALRIPDRLRAKLKADLVVLSAQAESMGDESISGLITYAKFRIDSN